MIDRRWLFVLATPALAWAVGLLALPRPQAVAAQQAAFDRSTLADVVSVTPTLPQTKADITFGGVIHLRGADIPDAALSHGARLGITLHVAPVAVIDGDWQVFVHIDPEGGAATTRINADHWPAGDGTARNCGSRASTSAIISSRPFRAARRLASTTCGLASTGVRPVCP